MKILIIGASGTIGKAVTNLFKEKGHEVIEASRSSKISVDITDGSSIDKLYSSIDKLDAIVTVAGDAAYVDLDNLTEEQIQLSLRSKLMGQINTVRKGIKKLNPSGVLVVTGGMLAYTPWPQTSMITMVNAGLEGFVKAAALDLKDGKRIMIVHPPWVAETAAALGMDASPWPNATTTALAYLAAIEGKSNGKAQFVKGYEPSM